MRACARFAAGGRIVRLPTAVVRPSLKLVELLTGPAAFATWDEAELLEVPLIAQRRHRRRRGARRDAEADAGGPGSG